MYLSLSFIIYMQINSHIHVHSAIFPTLPTPYIYNEQSSADQISKRYMYLSVFTFETSKSIIQFAKSCYQQQWNKRQAGLDSNFSNQIAIYNYKRMNIVHVYHFRKLKYMTTDCDSNANAWLIYNIDMPINMHLLNSTFWENCAF